MKNIFVALSLLLAGALLSEWLSVPDAQAQSTRRGGGGATYTHPSAISLPNGIDSQDGGTFTGKVKIGTSGFTPHTSYTVGQAIESQNEAVLPLLLQGKAGVGNSGVSFAPISGSSYTGLMLYGATATGCWGFTRSGGYGDSLIFCPYVGSGDTMAVISGHPTASTYGVRIQSYNGSALETAFETVGGWPKIPKDNAGAPAAGDCDAASESGRIVFDTTNFREYRCFGTAGWKYSQML